MFNKEEFKRLNAKRDEIIDNEFLLDIAWKNTISYVCQDKSTFATFIEYIKTEMTADEYIVLSAISDEIADMRPSMEFIEAYKSLALKYPEETKNYQIDNFIRDAENCVKYSLKESKKKNK